MNDVLGVDVNNRLDDLPDVHLGLVLSEPLPPLHQVLQGVIPAVL